jgi:DNA-binding transcriptional MerR regulator
MSEDHKKPMSLGAMARRLRVPARWLRAEADAGRIPHLRAGNALLFDPDVVERIILCRLRESSAPAKGVDNE